MFDTINLNIFCDRPHRRERINIPLIIGVDREAPAKVTKTPQYKGPTKGIPMITKDLTVLGQFTLSLPTEFKDVKGNPLTLDPTNPPKWSTENTDLVSLKPSEDGMKCDVLAVGPIGETTVQVIVDVDPTPDVHGGIGICKVKLTPGRLAPFELTASEETEQPEAPPVAPPAA